MPLSGAQATIANSDARFRVACCGRRFGKTFVLRRELCRFARQPGRTCWYIAPSYRMAKQIVWGPLKRVLDAHRWLARTNEQDLSATLVNGSVIALRGADKADSLRGVGLDFVVLDEAADIKPDAWTDVVRPMLADTGGHALIAGTPKGFNWFHSLWERGQSADEPDWASWQFTTLDGGNVPPEEVEAARRDLDEVSFRAEFEASFLLLEGRIYYTFERATHCAPLAYNPRAPLNFCFDFNVEPGIAVVCQEQELPNGQTGTGAIGEVHIPRNSNTPAVCRKLARDWHQHEGPIRLYGDATGGARGSARVLGADWDLVKATLREEMPGKAIEMRVPKANPRERDRVVAVNSRALSAAGEIRLMVDADKCPNLVRDLEGVTMLAGGAGEIDKKSDSTLTHCSDALGYFIAEEFAAAPKALKTKRLRGG